MIYGTPVRIENTTEGSLPLIVTVSEIKTYERMDASDTLLDTAIEEAIKTATMLLENLSGAVFQAQTFECYYDAFPDAMEIPLHPNQAITKIEYYDTDNELQELTDYDEQKKKYLTNIMPEYLDSFPDCYDSTDRVIVSASAGYSASDMPNDIKTAVKMTVSVLLNGCGEQAVPKIAKSLISKYTDTFKSLRIESKC